ncbi:MAG TPA: ABC transporter ATP-binding protein, partial [Pseudorhizobium sp.]|nr:ABC transporter ATP-binding protein [Pseudorhizobium sp.]
MILIRDLQYSYPGAATRTLGGVSFNVAAGEVYGLLGPSGAGKSTTQRIMMGLLRGYSGRVELFGQPIALLGRALYERIGVSFELPALYLRLTALENLKLFSALYSKPCRDPMDVLAEVELEEAANQRVDQFSKGMRMRLNLARALLHDPDLLFLDEPTTGQDPGRSRRIRNLIRQQRDLGKTIFLTTHNMAEAEEVCDHVGFLAGGHIPVAGSPAELMRQFGRRELEVITATSAGNERRRFDMAGIGDNRDFLELLATGKVV